MNDRGTFLVEPLLVVIALAVAVACVQPLRVAVLDCFGKVAGEASPEPAGAGGNELVLGKEETVTLVRLGRSVRP